MRKHTLMPSTPLGRRGQTILEYTVILIIILGVLVAMKDYIKRGIQGRWKSSTDDMGEQYDPRTINSDINYSTQVNSVSIMTVANGSDVQGADLQQGQWTTRMDLTNSVETKTGFSQVGT
jgi:Flp pilus assembly pilin Flp